MHYLWLAWRLLRYRVAIMLILFLLLGAAASGSVALHWWQAVLAAAALALSYISATSSNDLADEAIDKINHAGHNGRLLVSGLATRAQMWWLFGLSSVLAVILLIPLGWRALALIAVSILINVTYSLPPLRLSYRTWLAPLILGVGYVGVPFGLGVIVCGGRLKSVLLLGIACYCLFIGRIVLKDFRDRAGDATYGKPTLLLRHGKTATCLASSISITGGVVLLWLARPVGYLELLAPTVLFVAVITQVYQLWRAPIKREQFTIGLGAKLGNGALTILLGLMLLDSSGATAGVRWLFAAVYLAIMLYNYFQLVRDPSSAVNAYRG